MQCPEVPTWRWCSEYHTPVRWHSVVGLELCGCEGGYQSSATTNCYCAFESMLHTLKPCYAYACTHSRTHTHTHAHTSLQCCKSGGTSKPTSFTSYKLGELICSCDIELIIQVGVETLGTKLSEPGRLGWKNNSPKINTVPEHCIWSCVLLQI